MSRVLEQSKLERYTLTNKQMSVDLCNFGARILSIKFLNKSGDFIETTLNHKNDKDICQDTACMGATCGRLANRVSNASFFDGKDHHSLIANENNNTLHGGPKGFHNQYWTSSEITSGESFQEINFTLVSEDGDQGFPGKMIANVSYRLSQDNSLKIIFSAKSDKKCPVNMCNHVYFTLGEVNINKLQLCVNADYFLPVDKHSIPSGEVLSIPPSMDFSTKVNLKDKLINRDFDDCYVLSKQVLIDPSLPACTLSSADNDIELAIFTDQIAMQVYSGNHLNEKHAAIALEAQGLVDAVNQVSFECDWVEPDKDYKKFVQYRFYSK